jgi:hypothetical protein
MNCPSQARLQLRQTELQRGNGRGRDEDLPPEQRDRYFLRDLVRSYTYAPAEAAEEVLFKLAEADPHFYFEHEWRSGVIALDTISSARRLIDLVASGALDNKSSDSWHLVGLLTKHADLRRHV